MRELNSQQGETQQEIEISAAEKNVNVHHCVSTKGCRLTGDVLRGWKMFQPDGEKCPSLESAEAECPCGFVVAAFV